MITSFNPENKAQFELYSRLFEEANEVLNLDEDNKITALDQYFAHMRDLIDKDKKYLMIPLDETSEGIFTINANDRTITIPSQFSKCGAVQNDTMCEIAVFTVDRYFDFQDLDMTDIYVQWINANNEQGFTAITLKDNKTYPGKLRFGWPLTSQITKKDGPVQFAVRFCREVVNENTDERKVHYVLNTLPAILNVKKGLILDNIIHEEENLVDLFEDFVFNSNNPAYIDPAVPQFGGVGQDLIAAGQERPGIGAINPETDSLIMTAQAVANDLNPIYYDWFFSPVEWEDGKATYPETYRIVDGENGYEIKHNIVWLRDIDNNFVREGSQKYYYCTKNSIEEPETVGIEALELWVENTFNTEENYYYIVGTQLIIHSNDSLTEEEKNFDVVGKYQVEATVRASFDRLTTGEKKVKSTSCVLLAPTPLEFEKNLPIHQFIRDDEQETSTVLEVQLKNDEKNPYITCEWFKSETETDDCADLISLGDAEKDAFQYEVTQPGWYSVLVKSKLNRKTEDNEEQRVICKVTKTPAAPEVTGYSYMYFNNEATIADIENAIKDEDNENWVSIDLDTLINPETGEGNDNIINGNAGAQFAMRIDTNLDNVDSLSSDELLYEWTVQMPEGKEFETITIDKHYGLNNILVDPNTFNLNSKILVARLPQEVEGSAYNFACKISNIIYGNTENDNRSATTNTANEYSFSFQ